MRTPAIFCAALLLTLAVGCGDDENPETGSGLPRPFPGVYDDFGVADTSAGIRALIGFATRDVEGLDRAIEAMYDPEGGSFRQYMTVDDWMAKHAPPEGDVQKVESWLGQQGFTVAARASNRLLVEFIRRNDDLVAGLTLPQVVSVAMMAAGAAWLVARRESLSPAPG